MTSSHQDILRIGNRTDQVKPCSRCGAHFHRNPKDGKAQWEERKYCSKRCAGLKRNASDYEVRSLYRSGLSAQEVSELTGVSSVQIQRIIKSYGETRTASERQKLSQAGQKLEPRIVHAIKEFRVRNT